MSDVIDEIADASYSVCWGIVGVGIDVGKQKTVESAAI
jgi:hypothetical protein